MSRPSANINVMVRAAQKAARALIRDFGEVEQLQVSQKGPANFVSIADTRAERTIREVLQHARPGYGFLMEESGETAGSDGQHRWIVDPLDGTTNFLHGIPHFCTSIALERDGDVIAGVIHDPIRDETFWAEKNNGAFLSHQRLRVSARRTVEESVIATGIPHRGRGDHEAYIPRLAALMAVCSGVRRMGSAALDLAWVAAGRYDGYWEDGLAAWDLAAGIIIVREAGGFVTERDGGDRMIGSGSVVAANGNVQPQLLRLVGGRLGTGSRA